MQTKTRAEREASRESLGLPAFAIQTGGSQTLIKTEIVFVYKYKMCPCDLNDGMDALDKLFYELGPECERRLLDFAFNSVKEAAPEGQ